MKEVLKTIRKSRGVQKILSSSQRKKIVAVDDASIISIYLIIIQDRDLP